MKDNLQKNLVDFITGLKYENLPERIKTDAKYRLLDWVGSAIAGWNYPQAEIIRKVAEKTGGSSQATLLGAAVKVPAAQAALANGIIGHVVEFDDGHRNAVAHPGAVTVPVAIALAEAYEKTGKQLLTAIVAGYDVLIRLGSVVNPSHYKTWHTTGTCGTFAAAATAANILGLDTQQTNMAVGIAGTMACGSRATFGTYAKPLNAGHACQSGVQAAILAREGFTGPENIIGGAQGFIKATSAQEDTIYLAAINDGNIVADTAFFKVYASCGHTNSPLNIIFDLRAEHSFNTDDIADIVIETYKVAVDVTGAFKNTTEDEAKFSTPYCVAAALLYGKITLAEFVPEVLAGEKLAKLAKCVHMYEDPQATSAFPGGRKAKVTIRMTDGRSYSKSIEATDDRPDYEAVERKFMALMQGRITEQRAQELRRIILDMDNVTQIGELTQLLK